MKVCLLKFWRSQKIAYRELGFRIEDTEFEKILCKNLHKDFYTFLSIFLTNHFANDQRQ